MRRAKSREWLKCVDFDAIRQIGEGDIYRILGFSANWWESRWPDLFATATSAASVWVGVMPAGPRFAEFKRVVRSECEARAECISPNVCRFRDGRWVVAE